MKYKDGINKALIICPVESCDVILEAFIAYSTTPEGLDITTTFPGLDMHMVEHGCEPITEDTSE